MKRIVNIEKGKPVVYIKEKDILKLIDEMFLDLSGEKNLDDARKYFEEVRYKKFEKTKKLFELLNSHQLAVLFKLKQKITGKND